MLEFVGPHNSSIFHSKWDREPVEGFETLSDHYSLDVRMIFSYHDTYLVNEWMDTISGVFFLKLIKFQINIYYLLPTYYLLPIYYLMSNRSVMEYSKSKINSMYLILNLDKLTYLQWMHLLYLRILMLHIIPLSLLRWTCQAPRSWT